MILEDVNDETIPSDNLKEVGVINKQNLYNTETAIVDKEKGFNPKVQQKGRTKITSVFTRSQYKKFKTWFIFPKCRTPILYLFCNSTISKYVYIYFLKFVKKT